MSAVLLCSARGVRGVPRLEADLGVAFVLGVVSAFFGVRRLGVRAVGVVGSSLRPRRLRLGVPVGDDIFNTENAVKFFSQQGL